jgi:formate hydrogenlyase subunit 6/NADH:ubiquinone oxidoreductase subunit I
MDPETATLARPRTVNVLDDFRIDFARCMNCNICVEVCPFDALAWQERSDYPESELAALTHHWS